MAKTAAKVSLVSDTAGGKKSVARRSTGLDYSSMTGLQFSHFGVLVTASRPSSGHDRLSQLGNGS
jgi:hypothetical protein